MYFSFIADELIQNGKILTDSFLDNSLTDIVNILVYVSILVLGTSSWLQSTNFHYLF
jgi:hypothetical protein